MVTQPKRKILRWRREPRATGLAAIAQGERGWELWYGDTRIGTVSIRAKGWGREKLGYYFYAGDERFGVPRKNTASEPPFPDVEDAKAACRAYVEEHLRRGTDTGKPDGAQATQPDA
jgi:hypothetical protein